MTHKSPKLGQRQRFFISLCAEALSHCTSLLERFELMSLTNFLVVMPKVGTKVSKFVTLQPQKEEAPHFNLKCIHLRDGVKWQNVGAVFQTLMS